MNITNDYREGYKDRKDYELEQIIEGLVDRHGVHAVIGMLGGVCEGKGYFLKTYAQRPEEASTWFEKASRLWGV